MYSNKSKPCCKRLPLADAEAAHGMAALIKGASANPQHRQLTGASISVKTFVVKHAARVLAAGIVQGMFCMLPDHMVGCADQSLGAG